MNFKMLSRNTTIQPDSPQKRCSLNYSRVRTYNLINAPVATAACGMKKCEALKNQSVYFQHPFPKHHDSVCNVPTAKTATRSVSHLLQLAIMLRSQTYRHVPVCLMSLLNTSTMMHYRAPNVPDNYNTRCSSRIKTMVPPANISFLATIFSLGEPIAPS